jgi:membrane associated rhomboid family serine protease
MYQNNTLSISNILILISIFFTALTFIYPNIYIFGMNDIFYSQWNYFFWFFQMFSSQFLHGSILHLFMNSIFIYYFWNILEIIIGQKKMVLFFVLNSIFLWIFLTYMQAWNTVWISWFALAVLSYYTLQLYWVKNPEYTGWITAIVLNIVIGFAPWISLLGHLWGMIFWAMFWIITHYKKITQKKL